MANPPASPLEFLEDARPVPGENKFILGTFERGVTFYRQQIRALNLIYSMVEAKDTDGAPEIPPGCRIVVVGAGAFGITAAAAAAYAGFRVVLLERHQVLLHLQRDCNTRWIHPRFYDWPDPETESRLARLPLLDWPAATAAQVATELERQFLDLAAEKTDSLRYILDVSKFDISRLADGSYETRVRSASEQHIVPCHVVIYAVGLGTETAENETYWRNDSLGQTEMAFVDGQKVEYVVSGVGDGGLIDVFRLTIRDFRHERIFSEMFERADRTIFTVLGNLRTNQHSAEGWLHDQFSNIENGPNGAAITAAMNFLRRRRRSDTNVTLNGLEGSLRLSLTLERISLSNALLAYCLHRIGAFEYEAGDLDVSDPRNAKLRGAPVGAAPPPWLNGAKLIVRHGTDREKALRDVGCTDAVIDFMKRQKDLRDSSQPIYKAGWWGRFTAPADAENPGQDWAPVEFVPPALMTHATIFVSTLGNVLGILIDRKFKDKSQNFRVTLHRLVRFDGREVYQQITPYVGRVGSKAGLGRYFRVESGIVGLACRSGSLVVVRKTSAENFNKIWEKTPLDRDGAKAIKPYVDSLLACPFFAPETENGVHYVPMALFVDSADPEFFNEETREVIAAACRGFVDMLEDLHKRRALRAVPSFYPGVRVERGPEIHALISQLQGLGAEFTDTDDRGWKDGLTFKTLNSLDLEVGPLMKLAQ